MNSLCRTEHLDSETVDRSTTEVRGNIKKVYIYLRVYTVRLNKRAVIRDEQRNEKLGNRISGDA